MQNIMITTSKIQEEKYSDTLKISYLQTLMSNCMTGLK